MNWLGFDHRRLRARNANSLFDVRLREIMGDFFNSDDGWRDSGSG